MILFLLLIKYIQKMVKEKWLWELTYFVNCDNIITYFKKEEIDMKKILLNKVHHKF